MNQTQIDKQENIDKDFNKKLKPLLKGFREHLKQNKQDSKKKGQVENKPLVSLPQKRF